MRCIVAPQGTRKIRTNQYSKLIEGEKKIKIRAEINECDSVVEY
jgi:hypothetical protein